MEPKTINGADLRIGDTIAVWWTPRRDTIVSLEPYRGPLEFLWPEGASIAGFAIGPGMTCGHDEQFKLLARAAA